MGLALQYKHLLKYKQIADLSPSAQTIFINQMLICKSWDEYLFDCRWNFRDILNIYAFISTLSIQTCHMLMAEPSTYDMFVLLKKNGYVDG